MKRQVELYINSGEAERVAPELVTNPSFDEIYLSNEMITNGDFNILPSELITNGSFDSGLSNWTSQGDSITIVDGAARISKATSTTFIQQNVLTSGKTYLVEFDVLDKPDNFGTLIVRLGSNHVYNISDYAGTRFSQTITSAGVDFRLYSASTNGVVYIDNISVKEKVLSIDTSTYSTGWYSSDSDISISDGKLILTNGTSVGGRAYGTNGVDSITFITSGKSYRLSYTIEENDNNANLLYHTGGAYVTAPSTVGVHTIDYQAGGSIFLLRNNSSNATIKLDNISIKEISTKWVTGTGWSILGGSAIRTSGLTSNTYVGMENNLNIVSGVVYQVSYRRLYISGTSGQTNVFSYFDSASTRIAKGNYTSFFNGGTELVEFEFTAGHTGNLDFRIYGIDDFNGTISEVSVKEKVSGSNDLYTRADMFDFEDINYTTRIKDIRDIAKVLTDYSHSFTLPASGTNNKLFGHFDRFEVTGGFDARFKRDALIKINGIDFRKGSISLGSANLQKGQVYSYTVNFFGETVSLKQLIGDDTLESITGNNTYLDDFNHTITGEYISTGYSSGYNYDESDGSLNRNFSTSHAGDYCFPFISADDYYYYDTGDGLSPSDNGNKSRNIHPNGTYNSSLNQYTGIRAYSLKPAIKIKWIIKSIEQKYGLTFSDDFFNDTNPVYDDMMMWLNREKGSLDKQVGVTDHDIYLSDFSYSSGVDVLVTEDTFFNDSVSFDFNENTRTRFTITPCDAAGVTDNDGVWSFDAVNAINNERDKQHINIQGAEEIDCNWKSDGTKKPKFTISTNGSISHFKVSTLRITRTSTTAFPIATTSTDGYYNYDGFTTPVELSEGLNVSRNLPDMKILDFLTTLFKMFNLTAYFRDGQIVVRELDAYYADGRYFDISEYVDYDKMNVNKTLLYNKIDFLYEGQDTFALSNANNITGDEFGNERVDHRSNEIGSNLAFDGNKTYSVKLPLEKMMFEKMTDQDDETVLTSIQWGWMANEDSSSIKGKPVMFYPNKVTGVESHRFSYQDGSSSILKTTAILPSNQVDITDNDTQSTNFGSEYNEYNGETNEVSLYQSYYRNYVNAIYNEQSRLFNMNAILPVSILLRIEPNDKFIINNKRYRINKFETNLTDGKTKLELINELEEGVVISTEESTVVDTSGDDQAEGDNTGNQSGDSTSESDNDTSDDTGSSIEIDDTTDPITVVSFTSTTTSSKSASLACALTASGTRYTSSSQNPGQGDYVYVDSAGLTAMSPGWYKHGGGDVYRVGLNGLVIDTDNCVNN